MGDLDQWQPIGKVLSWLLLYALDLRASGRKKSQSNIYYYGKVFNKAFNFATNVTSKVQDLSWGGGELFLSLSYFFMQFDQVNIAK